MTLAAESLSICAPSCPIRIYIKVEYALIWTQAAASLFTETYCERGHGRNNMEELDILDMTGIQKRSGVCKKGHVQRKESVKQSKSHFDVRELSTASKEKSVHDLCSGATGAPWCSQLC